MGIQKNVWPLATSEMPKKENLSLNYNLLEFAIIINNERKQ